ASVTKAVAKVRRAFDIVTSGQEAALASIGDHDEIERRRRLNAEGIVELERILRRHGFSPPAAVGNFLYAEVGEDARPLFERLLFLATLGSGTGTWLAFVALTVDVYDRTHSGVWISALLIADFLPTVLIGLTIGPLVDRLSRRTLMVAADITRFGVFCALPFA